MNSPDRFGSVDSWQVGTAKGAGTRSPGFQIEPVRESEPAFAVLLVEPLLDVFEVGRRWVSGLRNLRAPGSKSR